MAARAHSSNAAAQWRAALDTTVASRHASARPLKQHGSTFVSFLFVLSLLVRSPESGPDDFAGTRTSWIAVLQPSRGLFRRPWRHPCEGWLGLRHILTFPCAHSYVVEQCNWDKVRSCLNMTTGRNWRELRAWAAQRRRALGWEGDRVTSSPCSRMVCSACIAGPGG